MAEKNTEELYKENCIRRANRMLANLGLTWEDFKGKTVLDAGSGDSFLAAAAKFLNINTNIASLDINPLISDQLPLQTRQQIIKGRVQELPFSNNSFDLVVSSGVGDTSIFPDGSRIIKSGGSVRSGPLTGFLVEMVETLLIKYKGIDEENVFNFIDQIIGKAKQDDNTIDRYYELSREAEKSLSGEDKMEAIDKYRSTLQHILGMPLTTNIISLEGFPIVSLVYEKPLEEEGK
jgi:ubiquinone/menaquinone biosynthesis C-methylase UbiE